MSARAASLLVIWLSLAAGVSAITLVSVDEEIAIGREAQTQMRREMPAFTDPQVAAYVRGVGERLVRHARGPEYPYSFSVADYREINGFALPGGPIWMHRGVLHAAANESQVAAVLAHEIAHVGQRHAASRLTTTILANWGLGLLGALLGNTGGAGAAQVAAGVLASGAFLKFSRDDEREADTVGLAMMRAAGWDGRGMVELFGLLEREADRNPGSVNVFFSSHPSPQDRMRRLQAEAGRGGGARDSREFQTIRARVLRMRAPREMPRD